MSEQNNEVGLTDREVITKNKPEILGKGSKRWSLGNSLLGTAAAFYLSAMILACSPNAENNAAAVTSHITPPDNTPTVVNLPPERTSIPILIPTPTSLTESAKPSLNEQISVEPTKSPNTETIKLETPPNSNPTTSFIYQVKPGEEGLALFPETDKKYPFSDISDGSELYISPDDVDYIKNAVNSILKENPFDGLNIDSKDQSILKFSADSSLHLSVAKSTSSNHNEILYTYRFYSDKEGKKVSLIYEVRSNDNHVSSARLKVMLDKDGQFTNKKTNLSSNDIPKAVGTMFRNPPTNWIPGPGSIEAQSGNRQFISYARVPGEIVVTIQTENTPVSTH